MVPIRDFFEISLIKKILGPFFQNFRSLKVPFFQKKLNKNCKIHNPQILLKNSGYQCVLVIDMKIEDIILDKLINLFDFELI